LKSKNAEFYAYFKFVVEGLKNCSEKKLKTINSLRRGKTEKLKIGTVFFKTLVT
jgi:hypothetical protein